MGLDHIQEVESDQELSKVTDNSATQKILTSKDRPETFSIEWDFKKKNLKTHDLN